MKEKLTETTMINRTLFVHLSSWSNVCTGEDTIVSVLPDYQEQARQRQRRVMTAAALTNIRTLGQF